MAMLVYRSVIPKSLSRLAIGQVRVTGHFSYPPETSSPTETEGFGNDWTPPKEMPKKKRYPSPQEGKFGCLG